MLRRQMTSLKSIGVVSFNANEARAVSLLLDDLANGIPSPWQREGDDAVRRVVGSGQEWRVEHVALLAQGNVLAAARLAEFFQDHQKAPDYVVFYGCAGAVDPQHAASMFLVQGVNYLSLGTVAQHGGQPETVTLKNKWLCHLTSRADAGPLEAVNFPMCNPGAAPLDLCKLSGVPSARVAATDKVVRIAPSMVPTPVQAGPPHDRYAKGEWSYGQALALVAQAPGVVIVDMESFGIGRIAQALQIEDRVVVLRVTTDVLTDHVHSDDVQRDLLEQGRYMLGRVLAVMFTPNRFSV